MPEQRSSTPQDRPPIRQEGVFDARQMLARILNKGTSPLGLLEDANEQRALADWFVAHHEELDPDTRAVLLEEFIGHDLVDDEQAFRIVRRMDPEQRGRIGAYIGLTIKGTKYLKTFHRAWFDIPYDGRAEDPRRRGRTPPSLRSRILRRYLKDEFESVAMIAPFTRLQTWPREPMGQAEILDSVQQAYDMVKQEPGSLDATVGADERTLWPEELLTIADHFKEAMDSGLVSKTVLIPHLPWAVREGIITPSQATDVLNQPFAIHPMMTRTEQEEQRQIVLELEAKQAIAPDDPHAMNWFDPARDTMRRLRLRYQQIDLSARERALRHTYRTFPQWKTYLDDPIEHYSNMLEMGEPIFSVADLLDLDSSTIEKIAKKARSVDNNLFHADDLSDAVALLRLGATPDVESLVLEEIIGDLRYGLDGTNPQRLMLHARDVLPEFSEEGRQRLIEQINRRAPELWLLNLRYAVEHSAIPLRELIERAKTSFSFIDFYTKLLFELRRAHARERALDVSEQEVEEALRVFFRHHPAALFYKKNAVVAQELFNREEMLAVAREVLRPPVDEATFSSIFDSSFAPELVDDLHRALQEDGLLFSQRVGVTLEEFLEMFGAQKVLDMLERHAARTRLDEAFERPDFVKAVAQSRARVDRVLDVAQQSGKQADIARLIPMIDRIMQQGDPAAREEQERKLVREVQKLQGKLSSANRLTGKEKEERVAGLQSELNRATSQLDALNKQATLSSTEKAKLSAMRERVREALHEAVAREPDLVFERDVANILGVQADPFIRAAVDGRAMREPIVLVGGLSPRIRQAVGPTRFQALLERHEREFVFLEHANGDYQDEKAARRLRAGVQDRLHPRLAIDQQARLLNDYYEQVLLNLRRMELFRLYRGELETIAQDQRATFGIQDRPADVEKPEAWMRLTARVAALQASELAHAHLDMIEPLPAREREELLDLLETVSILGLDSSAEFGLRQSRSPDELTSRLLNALTEHVRLVFDLPEHTELDTSRLDAEFLMALKTFASSRASQERAVSESLRDLVVRMLGDDFEAWRQWNEPGSHAEALETMKERGWLPRNISLEQYETWSVQQDSGLDAVFETDAQSVMAGVRAILQRAVADHHVEQDEIEADPIALAQAREALILPLRALEQEKDQLNSRFAQERIAKKQGVDLARDPQAATRYEALKREIAEYRLAHDADIRKMDAVNYLRRLKHLSVEELQDGAIAMGKTRVPLSKVFHTLKLAFADNELFSRDLGVMRELIENARKELFAGGSVSKTRLTLTDRIDAKTYFFMGEKPVPSCQSYQSTMGYCGGLLGSMRDPNIKYVQVFSDDRIIARAALRLLSDNQDKPALFLERVYSTNQHPKIEQAIRAFAKAKADAMGVGLYGSGDEVLTLEGASVTLRSHGSRAPYVYTDAGHGLIPDGVYTVEGYEIV